MAHHGSKHSTSDHEWVPAAKAWNRRSGWHDANQQGQWCLAPRCCLWLAEEPRGSLASLDSRLNCMRSWLWTLWWDCKGLHRNTSGGKHLPSLSSWDVFPALFGWFRQHLRVDYLELWCETCCTWNVGRPSQGDRHVTCRDMSTGSKVSSLSGRSTATIRRGVGVWALPFGHGKGYSIHRSLWSMCLVWTDQRISKHDWSRLKHVSRRTLWFGSQTTLEGSLFLRRL